MDYASAPDVKELAQTVIDKWHPHLSGIPIEYVFALGELKVKGRIALGRVSKKSGLSSWLRSEDDEQFFVMEIAKDFWDAMGPKSRTALLDHELSHCNHKVDAKGDLQLYTVTHDVEEFNAVILRHGLWQPDLVELARTIRKCQPSLFDIPVEDDERELTAVH